MFTDLYELFFLKYIQIFLLLKNIFFSCDAGEGALIVWAKTMYIITM